ncbi:MAG: hypothetical protein R3246_11095, partial [Acidimicrobiia bacterium]|nr:hypothetical protein [Acidimicrobiia bacterium]
MLHRIAPFGLAASAGTALIVDLDPRSPSLPGPTLATLLAEGLTARHLRPARKGVAVVGNGGISPKQADELLRDLLAGWPAVVLRMPLAAPAIPVLPLEPPEIRPDPSGRAVWQAATRGSHGPGLVLPPVGRTVVRRLCRGQVEPRHRWVRAWTPV